MHKENYISKTVYCLKKTKKNDKKIFFPITDYQLSLKIQNTFIDKTNH